MDSAVTVGQTMQVQTVTGQISIWEVLTIGGGDRWVKRRAVERVWRLEESLHGAEEHRRERA